MLVLGRRASNLVAGRRMAELAISSGTALKKFRLLVVAQDGDVSFVDDTRKFPVAQFIEVVKANQSGYLAEVNARIIGEAAVTLGAGRAKKGDPVDHAVGFIIHRKVGDFVEKNQPLFTIHANDKAKQAEARETVMSAFKWSAQPVPSLPLFYS
jgi:pyrimidine-nucleoside phosphorylase